MAYVPRRGLSYACIDEQIILLDILQNRYSALSGTVAKAFRDLIGAGAVGDGTGPDEQSLLSLGLVIWQDDAGTRPAVLSSASRDVPSDFLDTGKRWDLARACLTMIMVRRMIATSGLAASVQRLVDAKASKDSKARSTAVRRSAILASYRRAIRILPSHDRCLSNSLALALTLVRTGIDCELVFGVAIRPFAAHCWVQAGDELLNDRTEHIRGFTPILAL